MLQVRLRRLDLPDKRYLARSEVIGVKSGIETRTGLRLLAFEVLGADERLVFRVDLSELLGDSHNIGFPDHAGSACFGG
ncbi:hypothetical protein ACTJKE_21685 [Ensifer sp. 22521]|uniref:hypothetical protein n=1 Tax=Ensifer sp. 22521 TaxID=3453935 RepID=UPI000DE115E4